MTQLKGIFPALLTPYQRDGSINGESIKKCIEMNLGLRVAGFYVGGSTGEGVLLTDEERMETFRYAAEANAGRSTIIAHVGSISTARAIRMARYAESVGCDAISAVAPFYYNFSFDAVKQYYFDIADSVKLPLIIYNYPASGSFSLTKQGATELFAHGGIRGVKHTSNDLFMISQFKAVDKSVAVFNGFDEMLLGGLSMGADGGIGSTYNFLSGLFVPLYDSFINGDIRHAQELQSKANEIISVLLQHGVMACEKEIMELLGIEMNGCRAPFLPLTDEGKAACRALVKKYLS